MKVLGICGSHRKGNSEIMLKEALRGAKESGAKTEIVLLRKLKFEYCDGCNDCMETKDCKIKDDLTPVLEESTKADALVLASPNYFNNVSGMMKTFIDRTNYLYETKGLNEKRAGLISAGGASINSIKFCENALKEFCKIHKMKVIGSVKAVADETNEIKRNKKALKECFELGRTLAKE